MKNKIPDTKVIDLFCGVGGLTHGFAKAGLNVVAGIDNDPKCKYAYTTNNATQFILDDIDNIQAEDLKQLYGKAKIRILVGCAPCQPYSGLNQKAPDSKNMQPLAKFAKLIAEVKPDIVSMENVQRLANKDKYPVFRDFINMLQRNKYRIDSQIINAADYGVPQNRHRLVVLASRLGSIRVLPPTEGGQKTVRDAIGFLPAIRDGQKSSQDSLHFTRKLSDITKRRIKATPKNGGDARSWPQSLKPACHLRKTGRTFQTAVYGRMKWDKPAPTMTTQCIGFGNGRFGHPEQDRGISLREAALIQSFPISYKFTEGDNYNVGDVAKFIGNAVPVKLAEMIGVSIKKHIRDYAKV